MIELHGWLAIRPTFQDEELLSKHQLSSIWARIHRLLASNTCGIQLQASNGTQFLNTLYCSNHRTAEIQEIIDVYTEISAIATGSYGLLDLWDDEDPLHSNEFQVYVFKRGRCVCQPDTHFSPCVPTIEDPYC